MSSADLLLLDSGRANITRCERNEQAARARVETLPVESSLRQYLEAKTQLDRMLHFLFLARVDLALIQVNIERESLH